MYHVASISNTTIIQILILEVHLHKIDIQPTLLALRTMSHLDDATHITNPSIHPADESEPERHPWDAASYAWKENKIRRGEMYYYRCTAIQRNGQQCSKPDLHPIAGSHLCKMHKRTSLRVPPQTESR